METSIDFSALFMRTKIPGQYKVISSAAFEYHNIPTLHIGLKIVEPGYLGLVNCDHRLCYAMAPVDKIPHQFQLQDVASRLGFRGDLNRSYLDVPPSPVQIPLPEDEFQNEDDDIYDDEEHEIDRDPNKIVVF
ncbi:uncharacterized protein LOC105842058 [Bombyx mori]|uniref:Uncharacterized protein n=1 Tax=Bombyx mori TaxID=7091 RepID=A0A8R2C771_BOMMO|nr:uncharacterized protein LOC105842058 [Bombyx mori]